MKRKKLLQLILSSILLLVCCSGAVSAQQPTQQPAQAIMAFYANDLKDMKTIEPYIVSILALNEVEHTRHLTEVKAFIQWYFSKLNYPDKNGLTGTIYIYTLENGREYSTDKYDSVDGYSGLFLQLLHQYVKKSGDVELLRQNWSKIEDIAYTIPFMQDQDGLTRALPGGKVKYLMDNCEAYGGLSAYLELRKLTGQGDSAYYSLVRAAIQAGIRGQFYNPEKSTVAWAIENDVKSPSMGDSFYPGAYAQLFPIYYDVFAETPEVRDNLWRGFAESYKRKGWAMPIEQRIMYALTKTKMEGLLHDGR
jgi:hypothetical protein